MGLFNGLKKLFGKDKHSLNETMRESVKEKMEESLKESITAPIKVDVKNAIEINPIYLKTLSNGLLPGEILLIDWIDGKYIDSPPGYFSYRYGLNTEKSAAKLLDKGFITEASPVESLKSFKVPELKEILRKNGLKVSGKKQELINRLSDHLSEDEINEYIDKKPLKITDKGHQLLEEYYYIVPAHKNDSQDGTYNVATAIEYVNNFKGNYNPPSGDISWSLFQEVLLKHHKDFNFGLYRNVHLNMAQQLLRERKFKGALTDYLKVFIIDMSGLGNNATLNSPKLMIIAPGIIKEIERLCEELELNEESIKELFGQAWERIKPSLPFHLLDKERSYQCLLAAFEEKEDFIKETIQRSYKKIDKETFETTYNLRAPFVE